jgi:hypothetical protein
MTRQNANGVSRRNFVKVATVTAVAAAATGGGAALLKRGVSPVVISTNPPTTTTAGIAAPGVGATGATSAGVVDIFPTVAPVAGQAGAGEDILAQLAAAQAENMQLRAQLDQALADLGTAQSGEQNARGAHDALVLELDGARNQLGILGGLVALYEQLDQADLGGVVENGLGVVGQKLSELVGGVPALSSGLDGGQLALGEIEAHIPLLDNGRQWLGVQADKMRGFYGDVESWLQRAVERVGNFLEMLQEWFEGLRRWLPFGAGEKAAGVMSALTALLAETPTTLTGLDTNIAQPLDVWLQRIDGEPALQRRLVRPLRDEVIARARTTADQANQVGTLFEEQLATPARAALGNRASLRQAITDYRAQNQI